MSNLTRKLRANLETRENKKIFWRWWANKKGPKVSYLRRGNKTDGYRWFRKSGLGFREIEG